MPEAIPDDQVRCPECGTTRLKVFKKIDRIEKVYDTALLNRLRARRGDTIYHCVFCRLQFYDPRKPGAGGAAKGAAEKSSAAEKTEPEPGRKVARAARAAAVRSRPRAPLDATNVSAGVTIR